MKRFFTAGATLSLFLSPLAFGLPTTQPTTPMTKQPTTAPAPGSYEAYQAEGTAAQKRYKVLVPTNDVLADANATQRATIAVQAIPMLKEILADLEQMARLKPGFKSQIMAVHGNEEAALYAIGDSDTVTTLNDQSKLPGRDGNRAKRIVLRARWYMAGQDPARQAPVIADVDQMAIAQPTDMILTQLIADMQASAQDPDVKSHMIDLLTNTMDNTNADACLKQIASNDKMHSFNDKPMVLAGKQLDGSNFTTADWKGKVVLVDFWATWCVPCREELPRVQKAYADYHDKGLEVLGVANDESGKQLAKIVGMLKLPWPQLFDADAAAKGAWNPITVSHGIDGIPVMFLIDKKGVCRTVTARDNFEKMIPQLLAE